MRLTVLMVLFVLLVNALFPQAVARIIPVRRGARRGAHARAAADGRLGHVVAWRSAHGHEAGDRQAARGDSGPGHHGRPVHRQDRHADRSEDPPGAACGSQGQPSERVLELAYLNSFFETGLKSPLDEAILAHQHIDVERLEQDRRGCRSISSGAASRCCWRTARPAAGGEGRPGGDHRAVHPVRSGRAPDSRAPGRSGAGSDSRAAYRAGRRRLPRPRHRLARRCRWTIRMPSSSDETELVFAGFAAFLDPPKASAPPRWPRSRTGGVAVKIVTGDSELVTQHVCAELNIPVTGRAHRQRDRPDGRLAPCGPGSKRRTCSAGSIPRRRTGSSSRSRRAATWSAISATASTMRRRCTRRTSAFRWTRRSMSPRKRPT